ncbi:hypothetical protein DTO280E4_9291 [Paecilomyces variotii]|nr:hypothetical protein DTO169E5_6643 [Paecilomyces variotii]KAJ9319925.1 hypothetical protein DTO027B3_9059 [Paecilomyces variotii]KAJ9348584.1 hypothetical protein DTO280E4_9291 [Paecilomyces variotii]
MISPIVFSQVEKGVINEVSSAIQRLHLRLRIPGLHLPSRNNSPREPVIEGRILFRTYRELPIIVPAICHSITIRLHHACSPYIFNPRPIF